MGAFGVFIIGTFTSMIASGIWVGANEVSVINQLAGIGVINVSSLGGLGLAKSMLTWFSAITTLLGWTYPYLDNAVGLVLKWTILYPVTIGVVWGIVEIAQSAIQGLAGAIRTLLP